MGNKHSNKGGGSQSQSQTTTNNDDNSGQHTSTTTEPTTTTTKLNGNGVGHRASFSSHTGGGGGGGSGLVHPNPWSASLLLTPHTYPIGTQLPHDYQQHGRKDQPKHKPFHKWERELLKTTFTDLASRSASGKSIDKETFLKFFHNVPGMLGERLFFVFNRSGSGRLDFDEFLAGLSAYARGSKEQKVLFLFRMCNLSNSGRISRAELETLANNLVFASETIARQIVPLPPVTLPTNSISPTLTVPITSNTTQINISNNDHSQPINNHSPSLPETIATEMNCEAPTTTTSTLSLGLPPIIVPRGNSDDGLIGHGPSPGTISSNSALDTLSPSEPDWLHSNRVKQMIDGAFGHSTHETTIATTTINQNGVAVQPITSATIASSTSTSSTIPPTPASASAPAPAPVPPKPVQVDEPGLSMYQFGSWLNKHPDILELLDTVFLDGLLDLEKQQHSHTSTLISAIGGANNTVGSRGNIVGIGSNGLTHRPSFLVNDTNEINSSKGSPFHTGSQLPIEPLLPIAASDKIDSIIKLEEKATWKNGPRLSVSAATNLLVPSSTRGISASIGGGRFTSHSIVSPSINTSHDSTPSTLSMGMTSRMNPSTHLLQPFHLHCQQCGFDLYFKYCIGCGCQLTCPIDTGLNHPTGGGGGGGGGGGILHQQSTHPTSSASVPTSPLCSTTSFPTLPTASSMIVSSTITAVPLAPDYSCTHCSRNLFGCGTPIYCPLCGCEFNKSFSRAEPPLLKSLAWQRQQRGQTSIEGYLKKVGARLKNIMSRWYVIRDNFMYTYNRPQDFKPAHVLFLEGCFVEPVNHEDRNSKLKYGIEIILSEEPRKSRFVYASSSESRQQWLESIRIHANVHDIEEFYTIGQELGVGRFSSVREGISKQTGKRYAIKIIDKSEVNDKEREALRTEVAVLKLVHHPSIIRLKNVFESRKQIFIVMSFVRGGDLFDRLVKRKRFNEPTTQAIMIQLLQVVQYLHVRGIVHRDLKPENIMMVSDTDDTQIMLADFGLGAFALPDQSMKLPCGTLTFTAPEVLIGNGYGMEVDLWSIGVICYMLIRGCLPFDGKTPDEIREKTIQGRYSLDGHPIWNDTSNECKDLIRGLLTVDPTQRLNCQQALDHPFFKLKFQHPPSQITNTPANIRTVSAPIMVGGREEDATTRVNALPLPLPADSTYPQFASTTASTSTTAAAAAAPPSIHLSSLSESAPTTPNMIPLSSVVTPPTQPDPLPSTIVHHRFTLDMTRPLPTAISTTPPQHRGESPNNQPTTTIEQPPTTNSNVPTTQHPSMCEPSSPDSILSPIPILDDPFSTSPHRESDVGDGDRLSISDQQPSQYLFSPTPISYTSPPHLLLPHTNSLDSSHHIPNARDSSDDESDEPLPPNSNNRILWSSKK